MLVVIALSFPVVLMLGVLGMERVERRLHPRPTTARDSGPDPAAQSHHG